MNPIYKFNNGRGATLCHLCRTIITTGKMTNDLYCDRCLKERNHVEVEFLKLKANLPKSNTYNQNTNNN
jgi:reverse gyrase